MTTRANNSQILYFSRGKGFGHAMLDILVLEQIKKLNSDLPIQIVSYADGYNALKANGFQALDLGLSADGDMGSDAIIKIGSIIKECEPNLIVSDEVFMALPLAKLFNIPTFLITHWFFEAIDRKNPIIPFVKNSNHIIFTDISDFHTVPPDLKVPVSFVGPIIRKWEYSQRDRSNVRKQLGIDTDDRVILVTTGGRHSQRIALFETAIEAFEKLELPKSSLLLLAGQLYQHYSERFENNRKVIVKDYDWKIDKLIIASDLVICAGTFTTLWELAFLGIPSISIPDAHNPVDNMHAKNMAKLNITIVVEPKTLNPDALIRKIDVILGSPATWDKMSQAGLNLNKYRGQEGAARIVNDYLKSALS